MWGHKLKKLELKIMKFILILLSKKKFFVEPYDMTFKCCNIAFGMVRMWLSNLLDSAL
jgi:hypothetical protein